MARTEDAAMLCEIERSAAQAFLDVPALRWIADSDVQSVERHVELIAGETVWVAVDDCDCPVAFLSAEVQGRDLHIWELSVRRDLQGKGIGKALVMRAADDARQRGMEAVTLTTFRDVRWNRPFYEGLGFRVLGADEVGERLRGVLVAEVAHGLGGEGRCAMRLGVGG